MDIRFVTQTYYLVVLMCICFLFSCTTQISTSHHHPPSWSEPVIFGKKPKAIHYNYIPEASSQKTLAMVELIIIHIPQEYEGQLFTLVGGGVDVGLHGPNATGFSGVGIHFAGGNGNPPRTIEYKKDYTKQVENGSLHFTIYYTPTDIIQHWDPTASRYVPMTEVTLTMHPLGEWNSIFHSTINPYNWCIAGVGKGNKLYLEISLE